MSDYTEERLRAIQIIESLRSGVPTRLSTRALPDLRPDLMETIRMDLESLGQGERPRGRLIWGQYGQGKSHFLTAVEHLALDMNFAVSFVSLSREVSCHNAFNFYRRVAPILRTPKSQVPGLQKHLLEKRPSDLPSTPIQSADRYPHRLPAVVLELLLHSQGDEDSYALYNDLMGYRLLLSEVRRYAHGVDRLHLLRNQPRFKIAHAPAYFGVLADAIRLCGFGGWVILIDEMELVARLGKVSRLEAYRNLNWLLNWSGDVPYPIYTLAACASSLQHVWHDDTRGRRNDSLAIPELAEARFGPDAASQIREFFRASGSHCVTIGPVKGEDMFQLLTRVVQLHGLAHDWNPPASEEWLRETTGALKEDEKVRTYIRLVMEALDLLLATGATPRLEPVPLTEHSTEESEEDSPGEHDSEE